jgi:hypothetical protein
VDIMQSPARRTPQSNLSSRMEDNLTVSQGLSDQAFVTDVAEAATN